MTRLGLGQQSSRFESFSIECRLVQTALDSKLAWSGNSLVGLSITTGGDGLVLRVRLCCRNLRLVTRSVGLDSKKESGSALSPLLLYAVV